MTLFEYALENTPIHERPECPACSALMYLALIEPEKPGFDLRTFGCPRCEYTETVVVEFAL
jgi:ribosomal protein S27AE